MTPTPKHQQSPHSLAIDYNDLGYFLKLNAQTQLRSMPDMRPRMMLDGDFMFNQDCKALSWNQSCLPAHWDLALAGAEPRTPYSSPLSLVLLNIPNSSNQKVLMRWGKCN